MRVIKAATFILIATILAAPAVQEGTAAAEGRGQSVLKSKLAGSWYPSDAGELKKQIAGFLDSDDAKPIENIIALILPHAGYRFSGATAAAALKAAGGPYSRVVVIGPSHRVPMEDILSVPRATHYETPLGRTQLDAEFIDKLLAHPVFQNIPHAHRYEHSVQIELPLLQHVLPDFKLVPIVAGRCSPETIEKTAEILAGLVDEGTLVVASTDFTHYGPNYGYTPFTDEVPRRIRQLDMAAYGHIAKLDAKSFLDYRNRTGATICGYVSVAVMVSMLAGQRDVQAQLVRYTTSGEITGDYKNSVSYISAAFSGRWRPRQAAGPADAPGGLSAAHKAALLDLARKAIAFRLDNKKVPDASDLGADVSPELSVPRAAFVTLKKGGRLRGCIGDLFPMRPLYVSVIENAVNAAFNDRRFSPLSRLELDSVTIQISALTQPRPVDSAERIRLGTDGVILQKDGRSAVFLPQVAVEQNWDLEQTLTQLSLKAGLAADAWKQATEFTVFQAEVFGEGLH